MTAPDALMSVQSLVVRYGSALALQGVPLELNAGDVVAVPGSNVIEQFVHRVWRSPITVCCYRADESPGRGPRQRLRGDPGRYLSESAGTASA
jgi:hypothetical protein